MNSLHKSKTTVEKNFPFSYHDNNDTDNSFWIRTRKTLFKFTKVKMGIVPQLSQPDCAVEYFIAVKFILPFDCIIRRR